MATLRFQMLKYSGGINVPKLPSASVSKVKITWQNCLTCPSLMETWQRPCHKFFSVSSFT